MKAGVWSYPGATPSAIGQLLEELAKKEPLLQ
jgi:hypothetical protein